MRWISWSIFAMRCCSHALHQLGRDLLHRVGFDDVALFEILELRDLNAALEAFGDFAHVVFEAPQAFDFAVEDDRRSRE